jgi:hypothetical protein
MSQDYTNLISAAPQGINPAPLQDEPEEFAMLLYCYFCGCVLNQKSDPKSREVEPQTCARCKESHD